MSEQSKVAEQTKDAKRPSALFRSVRKMVEAQARDAASTSDGGGSGRSDTNDNTSS